MDGAEEEARAIALAVNVSQGEKAPYSATKEEKRRCPHCSERAFAQVREMNLGVDQKANRSFSLVRSDCPCGETSLYLRDAAADQWDIGAERLIYPPASSSYPPPPAEVPSPLAADYREACLVIAMSPKASAALSRRCLQIILRDRAGVRPDNLNKEIDEAIAQGLPTSLEKQLDAVRVIGNFAAHPNKSSSTGEVVDVEAHEATWNIETLQHLFDHFYARPAQEAARLAAINAKLEDASKRTI
jgi:hypothetical protein